MPDLVVERRLGGIVAGIDEAGRGPWAGPVIAAAVVLDAARLAPSLLAALDDSKRLSAARRARLFEALSDTTPIGIGRAEVAEIDALNILQATLLAMRRAVDRLGVVPDHALVDGDRAPALLCPVRCIVGGDGRSSSIAAASIVAKVTRDREMADLARRFPGYGWERNAGYGTAAHRAALLALGPTVQHRTSFAPIRNMLRPAAATTRHLAPGDEP
jgi:ribonuclease HII